MQNVYSTSWWDMTPLQVRERINQRIMDIEAPLSSVWAIENRIIETDSRATSIRVYLPNQKEDLPVILLIHGGAWVAGNLDTHDNLARYLCSQVEAIVVSVGYMNAPEGKFPLQLHQSLDALTWMINHANEFSANLPTTLVLLAEKDELRSDGECFVRRLKESGVPTFVYLQKGTGHLAGHGARASLQAKESLDVAVIALKSAFLKDNNFKEIVLNINNAFYNESGDSFDKIPFDSLLPNLLLKYGIGQKVLEIGSGAGALASWLIGQGYQVSCIEPAIELAQQAEEKGLKVYATTIQDFETDFQYDNIVAISSLIHIPKSDLSTQIQKIYRLLKPHGLFFVSFIEGEDEGLEDPTKVGKFRYFAKWNDLELDSLFSSQFELLENHKIYNKKMDRTFLLRVYMRTDYEE